MIKYLLRGVSILPVCNVYMGGLVKQKISVDIIKNVCGIVLHVVVEMSMNEFSVYFCTKTFSSQELWADLCDDYLCNNFPNHPKFDVIQVVHRKTHRQSSSHKLTS